MFQSFAGDSLAAGLFEVPFTVPRSIASTAASPSKIWYSALFDLLFSTLPLPLVVCPASRPFPGATSGNSK